MMETGLGIFHIFFQRLLQVVVVVVVFFKLYTTL